MLTKNKDFEKYAAAYHKDVKEIIILTNDASGGAGKFNDSWDNSQYFLAYIDLETNELIKGDGRVNWIVSDEQLQEHGLDWPYNFKKGTQYKLAVRTLIDKTVPEGRLASFYNRFLIVEVRQEEVQNEQLEAVLTDYRKPITFIDETLGSFELNKDYETFEGEINWNDQLVSVSAEVEADDPDSWPKSIKVLRTLCVKQKHNDLKFRTFASEQLTELANDWLEDETKEKITTQAFANRISLSELVVNFDGDYTAYYDDDDMFYGHIIDISGNLEQGLISATIAG